MASAVGINRYLSKSLVQLAFTQKTHSSGIQKTSKSRPPVFISANPSHVNVEYLSQLYRTCNHSCHRLANFDADGRMEAVNAGKLGVAVSHSSVVVSVFCRIDEKEGKLGFPQKIMPVTHLNGQLVGFGRAVSDLGLTASIYDVMWAFRSFQPYEERGLAGWYWKELLADDFRSLTNRGIYDISALCTEKERLFFEACGFGDDILGSTTMMYLR